jgi:hypothetical protein
MSKRVKTVLTVLGSILVLLVIVFIRAPGFASFFMMQFAGMKSAGNWEDDSKNWYRAFHENQPVAVKVIHSKYWKSDHFTEEFMYFFEVEATPEWRDAFLSKRNLQLISPSSARNFRENNSSDMTPAWFAADSVEKYDAWDEAGHFGSVWIDKTNGHIFFYDFKL